MISTLLFTSCVINKELHITVKDSSDIEIDSAIYGSDLEDISPDFDISPFP